MYTYKPYSDITPFMFTITNGNDSLTIHGPESQAQTIINALNLAEQLKTIIQDLYNISGPSERDYEYEIITTVEKHLVSAGQFRKMEEIEEASPPQLEITCLDCNRDLSSPQEIYEVDRKIYCKSCATHHL